MSIDPRWNALIAKWATLSPDTTVNKLAAINAITVTGVIPTSISVTGDQVLNCINFPEFNAVSTTAQANLLSLCHVPGQLLGGSSNTTHMLVGMLLANFTVGSVTIANLTALAQASVQPWWAVSVANGGGGLTSPVSMPDLISAGGLT